MNNHFNTIDMNRFLVIRFSFYQAFYYAFIQCKLKTDFTEYQITVMNGELEKEICLNNTIKEWNGCLQLEPSGNDLLDRLKLAIAEALGKTIGKPVKEINC